MRRHRTGGGGGRVTLTRDQIVKTMMSELRELAKGRALGDKEISSEVAPLLNQALEFEVGSKEKTVDALERILDELEATLDVEPPTRFEGKIPPGGAEWTSVLKMLLNWDNAKAKLVERRDRFRIPDGISTYYNVRSTKSSKLRTVVEPAALRIFLDRLPLDRVLAQHHTQVTLPTVHSRESEHTSRKLSELVRRLVNSHDLDDEAWSDAIPSQYFASFLAREIKQTRRPDYHRLLDKFLSSFTYRSDDSISLNQSHVLITPHESALIREEIENEDRTDPYYRQSSKTQAEHIDVEALHVNYLYGLALGITASGESQILRMLRDVSLEHLLGETENPTVLDAAGGWQPFRIPWLTARVLISLRQLDNLVFETRPGLKEVVEDACQSLLDRRTTTDGLWRSGVGNWVSSWESTGLCLEALLAWHKILPHRIGAADIHDLTTLCVDRLDEWETDPDFSSEEKANMTLAASILASVLLSASSEAASLTKIDRPTNKRLLKLLCESLEAALATIEPQTKQFCTIPQVAYYGARVMTRFGGKI